MTLRSILHCGTAIRRVLNAIQWWELWHLEPIRSGRRNDTATVLRLANMRDPLFFRMRFSKGGFTIECVPGLVNERLRIIGLPRPPAPANDAVPAGV